MPPMSYLILKVALLGFITFLIFLILRGETLRRNKKKSDWKYVVSSLMSPLYLRLLKEKLWTFFFNVQKTLYIWGRFIYENSNIEPFYFYFSKIFFSDLKIFLKDFPKRSFLLQEGNKLIHFVRIQGHLVCASHLLTRDIAGNKKNKFPTPEEVTFQ